MFSATLQAVVTMAPRISHRVLEEIVRLDSRAQPIAETYRRVAAEAERLGLTRPSYQRIRELVHESRRIRRGPTAGEIFYAITAPLKGTDDAIERARRFGVRPLLE
jgi:hypothetical protein